MDETIKIEETDKTENELSKGESVNENELIEVDDLNTDDDNSDISNGIINVSEAGITGNEPGKDIEIGKQIVTDNDSETPVEKESKWYVLRVVSGKELDKAGYFFCHM